MSKLPSGVLQNPNKTPKMPTANVPDVPPPAIRIRVTRCRACPFACPGAQIGPNGETALCCAILEQHRVGYSPLAPPYEARIQACPLDNVGPILIVSQDPEPEEKEPSRLVVP